MSKMIYSDNCIICNKSTLHCEVKVYPEGFAHIDCDASKSSGSVSCEAHRPDIEVLEKAIQKCKEIDAEEIRKIFYSTFPADFLDGFISALEEKIKELSVR